VIALLALSGVLLAGGGATAVVGAILPLRSDRAELWTLAGVVACTAALPVYGAAILIHLMTACR
jgi:hypothetical protein